MDFVAWQLELEHRAVVIDIFTHVRALTFFSANPLDSKAIYYLEKNEFVESVEMEQLVHTWKPFLNSAILRDKSIQ